MKYGLIVHFDTQNIGDDIQAYAMEKFLPHVDYLIDREHLDSFYTPTGERVAAFLSGWYLHKVLNWPPSSFLRLLPVSFHMTKTEEKIYLALVDYGARWFKKMEPIGCRDEGTMQIFKHFGIESYVSGCSTLTIEPFADAVPHGKIALVDLPGKVVEFIRRHTKKETVIISHDKKKSLMPKEVVEFAEMHRDEDNLPTSHYPQIIDHSYPKSPYKGNWRYRRAFVEGLLKFYQGASLVVTSRLTVALSCLSLGTPVLMIRNAADFESYKFSTFVPYLNHTTPEDLLSGKYSFNFNNPPP